MTGISPDSVVVDLSPNNMYSPLVFSRAYTLRPQEHLEGLGSNVDTFEGDSIDDRSELEKAMARIHRS
jgi:hypothetical protein